MAMLQALLVTFREGIEAFLIVAVMTAYLRKTGRGDLVRGVRGGVVLSIATCGIGSWLWLKVPNQPIYEGVAALTAAMLVGALLWQTVRAGRRLKGAIENRIDRVAGAADSPPTPRALIGVAAVTTLLITREGLEAVFYLGVQVLASRASFTPARAWLVVAGAALGIVLAAVVSIGWERISRHLNLTIVLKVTALFLSLFLFQLVVYGIHELAESGVIEGSQAFHDATEIFGPDGAIGHVISYALLAAPLVYLLWAHRVPRPRESPATRPLNRTA